MRRLKDGLLDEPVPIKKHSMRNPSVREQRNGLLLADANGRWALIPIATIMAYVRRLRRVTPSDTEEQ